MGAAWVLRVPVGISALATIATICGAGSPLCGSRFPLIQRLERRCFELQSRHPRPIESAPEHSASGHYPPRRNLLQNGPSGRTGCRFYLRLGSFREFELQHSFPPFDHCVLCRHVG